MAQDYQLKKALAWSMYDWANSAFATTVLAGFFPVFFKQYWSFGTDVSLSTFRLGAANSAAGIAVALLAPLLGAIADRGGTRRRSLFHFTLLGIVMTGALVFVSRGDWQTAAFLFVLATIGFSATNIFYDALIIAVAPKERLEFVSSLGFSLGYLGGGILFAINILMTLNPQAFGLSDASEAVRASFATVALWWGIFSIPLFVYVDEPPGSTTEGPGQALREGFQQIMTTLKDLRNFKGVFIFLTAYWFYIDGIDTIIRMAVDYGLSLGLSSKSLLLALLLTQFVGFPAAIVFGKIGERFGPKTGIFIGLGVYLGVTVYGFFLSSEVEFYIMAGVIGLVQGGVQSLSRSFYARLIPIDKSAEFFGFYNMLGKFAAVVGPLLMGLTSLVTRNPRTSIFSVALLFIAGGVILTFVDESVNQ